MRLCIVLAMSACLACASTPPAASASAVVQTPKNGATRPASSNAEGFEAWLASEQRWVDPETFLAADKASRPANRFPDADVFPPFEQAREHDGMLLLTPDGPCEMYFFHTRWRRRADVRAWGNELRRYKACGSVFTREIGFSPSPVPTTDAAPAAAAVTNAPSG